MLKIKFAMKKITLLLLVLFLSFGAYAQFHVTSNYGDIEDGMNLQSNSLDHAQEVQILVHNDTEDPINVRLEMISMQNTDGENTELCFGGSCRYGVESGTRAPAPNYNDGFAVINPDQTNAPGDHFWNGNAGIDTNEAVTYEIQVQQLDASGSVAINTLTFTYTYDSELSVDTHQKDLGVSVMNTVVDNGRLSISTEKPVNVQIYNLLGQQVKNTKVNSGVNSIDISNLSSQIYLVRMQNEHGETKTQKIVVK